jgi:hypothetical protein
MPVSIYVRVMVLAAARKATGRLELRAMNKVRLAANALPIRITRSRRQRRALANGNCIAQICG